MDSSKCDSKFCNQLPKEKTVGCLTLIVFLLSCGYLCCVSLPRGYVG